MKKITALIAMIMVSLNVCAQYQTNYLSSTATTIAVRSVGYGRNAQKAISDAEQKAFLAVLYNGFEQASYSSAIIQDLRDDVEKAHSAYFGNFWDERCRRFIMSTTITQPFAKDSVGNKCIVLDVTINHKALREDLEKNGIIRKFGF